MGNPNVTQVGIETRFKPGVSGNPSGPKPGYKHITTHIQKLLEDDKFEANLIDAKQGYIAYKGKPVDAILKVLLTKAVNGDLKALEMLMKYGYSQKIEQENSGDQTITVITRNAGTIAPMSTVDAD